MPKLKILVVDDDPDIRDVLKITLTEEGYEVIEAPDGQEGLKLAQTKSPDLVIVDFKMPKLDGRQVCKELKKDILLSHMPIIMLTGKSDVSDKVGGIYAGADDYIVKPFEPQELIARISMTIRRAKHDLEANPLTRLPGNVSILNEIQKRIESNSLYAVCYLDLDKFKSYNDKYGFEHGDEVIKESARIFMRTLKDLGNPDDFIGHVGGDDFVIITTPDKVDAICQKIISEFDKTSPVFYNAADRKAGFIFAKDRQGVERKIPLLSISIGVVSNEKRKITHMAEIGEIGAELKSQAKNLGHSNYIKDQRQEKKP
ncbi:MAG: response regulator [Candidatus Omnitrophica bacterium]|nr:response regulator [Candidatus Omnitrophota bacterium]MDD5351576.1 response regulator [Candidatus Omnitrophota bacterium]MDD5551011.1 response regulator [Candidatus Omnitrophota bacterium]